MGCVNSVPLNNNVLTEIREIENMSVKEIMNNNDTNNNNNNNNNNNINKRYN